MSFNGPKIQEQINLCVDPALKNTSIEACKKFNISLSELTRNALEEKLSGMGFSVSGDKEERKVLVG